MSQDWSLTPTAATPPVRKGKGAITTGIVLTLIGLLTGIAGIVGVIVSAASLISSFGEPVRTPTTVTRTLEVGTTYVVYERIASGSGSRSDPVIYTVRPEDVTVTGPGKPVEVTDPGNVTQTFTSGSKTFAGVAQFEASASGTYQIRISTEDAEVLVAPAFSTFARSLAWVLLIALGGLLVLVGLITLIVGIVQRSSSKRVVPAVPGYSAPGTAPVSYGSPTYPPQVAPVAPALPPAGWYPDPTRPGGQRYWDGTGWTGHEA
jgi:hypothetical protein